MSSWHQHRDELEIYVIYSAFCTLVRSSKSNANSKTGGSNSRSHQRKGENSDIGSDGEDKDHDTDVTDVSRSTRGRRYRRPVTLDLGSSDNSIPAPRQR